MGTVVTAREKVVIAHVCSQCGRKLVRNYTLFLDGRANVFRHERDKAREGMDIAREQAYEDIVQCRLTPRRLGSQTQVETEKWHVWAFYQLEDLATPCECGHVEPWQLKKKSVWNPVDDPFQYRENIPGVPPESRPALLDSPEAVDAWFADPADFNNKERD